MEYNIQDITVAISLLTLFCIGTVELVKRAAKRDWVAVGIIAGSAVTGVLGAMFLLPVVPVPVGLAVGLGASGLVTAAQSFGQYRDKETVIE